MRNATVLPQYGLYPLGGVVNGADQMGAHQNAENELRGGTKVRIIAQKDAAVTTYGNMIRPLRYLAVFPV